MTEQRLKYFIWRDCDDNNLNQDNLLHVGVIPSHPRPSDIQDLVLFPFNVYPDLHEYITVTPSDSTSPFDILTGVLQPVTYRDISFHLLLKYLIR